IFSTFSSIRTSEARLGSGRFSILRQSLLDQPQIVGVLCAWVTVQRKAEGASRG
ncbi:unnamed protein product, partial [Amoebophrya sp. A120]